MKDTILALQLISTFCFTDQKALVAQVLYIDFSGLQFFFFIILAIVASIFVSIRPFCKGYGNYIITPSYFGSTHFEPFFSKNLSVC